MANGHARNGRGQRSVLVVLTSGLSEQVSGPEIRGWEIAMALAEHHRVTVAAVGAQPATRDGVRVVPSTPRRLVSEARRHDAVISPSLPPYLLAALGNSSTLGIADLYDPLELELDGRGASRRHIEVIRTNRLLQLKYADVLLCAAEPQRAQIEEELGRLALPDGGEPVVRVVPFGIPPDPGTTDRSPLRERFPQFDPGDKLILWWGSIWRWLDAETAIRAIAELAPGRPDLKLVFTAGRSPRARARVNATTEQARELAASLGVLDRAVFFFDEWIPYADRNDYLGEADVGLTLHRDAPEAEFAARARYMDYLWSGLPCVLARGDEIAARFADAGFAKLVTPRDVGETTEALLALVDEPDTQARAREAGRRLAEEYRWPAVVRPLLEALDRLTEGQRPRRRVSRELGSEVRAYYARRLPQKLRRSLSVR